MILEKQGLSFGEFLERLVSNLASEFIDAVNRRVIYNMNLPEAVNFYGAPEEILKRVSHNMALCLGSERGLYGQIPHLINNDPHKKEFYQIDVGWFIYKKKSGVVF